MKKIIPLISLLSFNLTFASIPKPSDYIEKLSESGMYMTTQSQAELSKLGGVRHPMIRKSKLIKRAYPKTEMEFGIELEVKNEQVLVDRLEQIYDRTHIGYKKFYAPGEFAKQHEAGGAEKTAIASFIKTAGLKIVHFSGRHLRVSGLVNRIEAFLNTRINEYEDPNGTTFLAAGYDVQVPASLGIASVVGLHTYPKSKKRGPIQDVTATAFEKRILELKSLFSLGVLTAEAVIPYNSLFIRAMYGIPAALIGQGQSMGINGLPFSPNDIALFWTSLGYNYAMPPVTPVSVNGFPTNLTPGQEDVETTVDITMALSMAPGLKEILVYEGGAAPIYAFNQAAIDNRVQTVTTSFVGENEQSQMIAMNTVLMQLAAQGQSAFTASGDDGDYPPMFLDPVDQPYITSVGGAVKGSGYVNGVTQIYPGESTWSQSGGGISGNWPIPTYQISAAKLNTQASQTMRNFPDVSAFSGTHYAPWYWIYVNGQNSGPWAGTSLSSPLWAAFTCLVNENNQSLGLPNIGFLNPVIYEIGASATYATAFHDMADGVNNGANIDGIVTAGYNAVKGWDLVTGWGSMDGPNLINVLASYSKPSIPPTPLQCGTWLEEYNLIPYISWGSMPLSLQSQWNALYCNQEVCTYFADKYGAVPNGSFGTLPENEQAIWNNVNCNWVLDPPVASTYPAQCQAWAKEYGVIPNKTWGSLPGADRYFWNAWNCNNLIGG